MIVASQKMDIVRRDQADAEVFRDLRQHAIALALFFHPVIVQFHEEIFGAQDVAILGRGLLGSLDVVRLNRRIDFPRETTAQPDQPRRMLRQQLLVDPRSVVKPVEVRG